MLPRIGRSRIRLLCILGLTCLSARTGLGQSAATSAKVKGTGREKPSLVVALKTDRDSYKLGDKITVHVLLTNTSKSPLYLYAALDWGESASLTLWVKDAATGKDVPEEFIADTLPPPPASKEAFIKLLPHHIYGVEFTSSLADLNIRQRGTYELVAEYHGPIPASMNFGLPIWSRENGSVSSNTLKIRVGE